MVEIVYIEKIVVVLINFLGFWLAFWVYSANKKEKLNQWFVIMTFFVILWVDFAFLGYGAKESFLAATFYRLNCIFVALFLISFYYFYVVYFFKDKNRHIILEKFVLTVGIIFSLLSVFSNFIIKDVIIQDWGAEAIFGKANDLFSIYALFVSFLVVFFLTKRYIHLSKNQKIKVQYFLTGTFFFILFNIIFNVVFPVITRTVEYQHYGDYSAILLLVFTAHAITKHNLMGIKTLLTQTLIVVISIILVLDMFLLSDDVTMQLLKVGILIIFLYFSRELVKSVRKEKEVVIELKKAYKKINHYTKRLEKGNEELEEANQKFKELLEMKNEFLHITSHQLRTPLTAIRGMLSMWYDGDFKDLPEKEKKRMLKRILVSADRLNNITNDMLDALELEGGYLKFQFKPVSIEKIIEETINTLKSNFENKNIYIKFKTGLKISNVEVEPNYIRQVFMNVIDNACKYTKSGGVDISISNDKEYIKIIIKDTGVGISKTDQKNIFEKFTRGKNAINENASGSGLGLFIARKIVNAHEGKIKIESKGTGKGTAVKIFLKIKHDK